MTKSLTSTLAAALIASAAFGGTALASGDYYEGASSAPVATVDTFQTSSVGASPAAKHDAAALEVAAQTLDSGDYYEGANRPQ